MKKLRILLLMIVSLLAFTCERDDVSPEYTLPPAVGELSSDIALHWANMTLYVMRFSLFNTPTYASRSLGYMGLAMYESIVLGDPGHRSVSDQLGLNLPKKADDLQYHWALSLNAAQDTLLKLLYPVPDNSHWFIHRRIDSLSNSIYQQYALSTDPETVRRSVEFGRQVAFAIYRWSLFDGGHQGYQHNFDFNYKYPSGKSHWIPPQRGQTISLYPLHPHWGKNRSFVAANKKIPVHPIVKFSTDTASAYYKLYKAVYEKNKTLTLQEREIAAWWSDDPTETFSPPGHSYYIAALAVKRSNADIITASEAFARVGMAVADAFIHCWKSKVTYFNERPSSYIRKYIDPGFVQLWPEPPFPAFPSGHSIHSAAAATVLTDLFGDSFSFTDDSHQGHRRYDDPRFVDLTYPARSYSSFWEAANESALSRFLGGIHTKQDNDAAQHDGRIVGANVNALQWRK